MNDTNETPLVAVPVITPEGDINIMIGDFGDATEISASDVISGLMALEEKIEALRQEYSGFYPALTEADQMYLAVALALVRRTVQAAV